MARQRIVSRTIQYTRANCLMINETNPEEVYKEEIVVEGKLSKSQAEKKIRKSGQIPEGTKLVTVLTVTPESQLYGMPEIDFIKSAVPYDEKTRKPITE